MWMVLNLLMLLMMLFFMCRLFRMRNITKSIIRMLIDHSCKYCLLMVFINKQKNEVLLCLIITFLISLRCMLLMKPRESMLILVHSTSLPKCQPVLFYPFPRNSFLKQSKQRRLSWCIWEIYQSRGIHQICWIIWQSTWWIHSFVMKFPSSSSNRQRRICSNQVKRVDGNYSIMFYQWRNLYVISIHMCCITLYKVCLVMKLK